METRYLLTLKAILETGSFQNAAKKLGYTQSTITFQMRQLEQEFSITLFEKIGRRMVLTQEGRHIIPQIDAILNSIRQIEDYSQSEGGLTGNLTITMGESWLLYPMQFILKEYKRLAPDVHFRMEILTNNPFGIQQILSGDLDVCLYYGDRVDTPGLAWEQVGSFSAMLVGETELASQVETLSQSTFNDHHLLVGNNMGCIFRNHVLNGLRKRDLTPEHLIELGSSEAIKKSMVNGLGFAFLPQIVLEEELAQGLVAPVDPTFRVDNIPVHYVFRKNRPITPALELLFSLSASALKQSNHLSI